MENFVSTLTLCGTKEDSYPAAQATAPKPKLAGKRMCLLQALLVQYLLAAPNAYSHSIEKTAFCRLHNLNPSNLSRHWELVAVDMFKVPISASGNQYISVAQDYFSKWPFA